MKDWIKKFEDLKNSGLFAEIERLQKQYGHGEFEELLRTAKNREEMLRHLGPTSEEIDRIVEQLKASHSTIYEANKAIADIIIDKRKYIETITGQIPGTEKSAAASLALSIPDVAHLRQFSTIGEISLAAQNMMADVNFGGIKSAFGISAEQLSALEGSFLGFTDSYGDLYKSIQGSKADIASSLQWFVTELPPVEIYTGAGLARVISRPVPVQDESEFPFEQDFVDDIEGSLEEMLVELDPGLVSALRGAKQSLKGNNPDRVRHVTVSLRELLTHVLRKTAPDEELRKWTSDPEHFHEGRPTRKARLLYICRSVNSGPFTKFVQKDVESNVSFISVFQEGTHGINVQFTEPQMEALVVRTEALLRFVLTVSKNSDA